METEGAVTIYDINIQSLVKLKALMSLPLLSVVV